MENKNLKEEVIDKLVEEAILGKPLSHVDFEAIRLEICSRLNIVANLWFKKYGTGNYGCVRLRKGGEKSAVFLYSNDGRECFISGCDAKGLQAVVADLPKLKEVLEKNRLGKRELLPIFEEATKLLSEETKRSA